MSPSLTGHFGAAVLLMCAALLAWGQTDPVAEQATSAPKNAPAAAPTPSTASAVQPTSHSLGLLVYPSKGQSASQQSVDEQECYNWAKTQTDVDPATPPSTPAAAPQQWKPGGQRVRSAARGAAAGALIGEVADNDADEGAKVGAAAGVLAGGQRAREAQRAREQQAKISEEAAQTESKATFVKAFGVCLQGRGYTTG